MTKFRVVEIGHAERRQQDYTYYKISEAADLLGISVATLRMYEREGLILPYRRGSQHRKYMREDIERLRAIRAMINVEKVSIAGIKRLFALIPCWKAKNCSEDLKEHCPAFNQHDEPCWTVIPRSAGCEQAECRDCTVYRDLFDCKSLKQLIARYTSKTEPKRAKHIAPYLEPIIHMPEVEIVPVDQ